VIHFNTNHLQNLRQQTCQHRTSLQTSQYNSPIQFGHADQFIKSQIHNCTNSGLSPKFGANEVIANLSPEKMSAVLSAQLSQKLKNMQLGDILTIGRAPDNNLVIPIEGVSRDHANIVKKADGFYIQDKGTAIEGISLCPGSTNGTQHVSFVNALPVIQDIRGPLKPLEELTPEEMAYSKTELHQPGPSVKLSQGDVLVMSKIRLHLDELPLTEKQEAELANQKGLFDDIPEEVVPGFPPKSFNKAWMAKRAAASDAYAKTEAHLAQLKLIYQHPHLIPRVPHLWIQQVKLLQNPEIQFQMYSRLTEMGVGSKLAKVYVLRLNLLAKEASQAIDLQSQILDAKKQKALKNADALKDSIYRDRLRD
jgi:pSer/pThr/pTyr-binding forkhead associated (FHA) protein